jgi:hypothetical protein
MAKYSGGFPDGYYDEDYDDGESYTKPNPQHSQNCTSNELQIKIIKPLGYQAGVNKSDFDIALDANAQQWFDKIHQYWRQCKLKN